MNRTPLSRRQWITGALGLAGVAANAKPFQHAIGAQLYTVRTVIGKAEDDTLRRIAAAGYTEVETTGLDNLDAMAPLLQKYKLKPVSRHLDVAVITGKWPDGKVKTTLAQSIDTARMHGIEYLVFPYVPPADRGSADNYRKLADQMNQAAEQVHAAGLTFCYHNHAFEFGGSPGQRAIDIFTDRWDKKLVNLELDVFWVSVAGHDPVEMLKQYKGRVPLIHLKDKATGTPVQYDEKVPAPTFKEVGSGSLDFPAILRAAEQTGVKHYFVEQDQTPADPVDSLAKSYRFLRNLNL